MNVNKKLKYNLKVFLIICPIILSLSACSESSLETGKTTAADVTIQKTSDETQNSIVKDDVKLEGTVSKVNKEDGKKDSKEDNNVQEKGVAEPFLFGKTDLYINKKPVINVTYKQLLKDFGEPEGTDEFKVSPPASEPDYYYYFKVLKYKGLQCEFNLNDNERALEPKDEVVRFDITDSSYQLDCGLKIGMTVNDIIKQFGKRNVCKLDSTNEDFELKSIKHVLNSYKPEGQYSGYLQAMIIYGDPEKFDGELAKAIVLLIKNDRLDRIVFGYPTAD